MKPPTRLILSAAAIILLLLAASPLHLSAKPGGNKYVEFLRGEGNVKNGVDYVIGLFERYDIVVLCERNHADVTQYTELIHKIIEHPYFVENVGNLFTEIGGVWLKEKVDSVMYSDTASYDDFMYIYRNASFWPMWTKRNYVDFLRHIYDINQRNPGHKINFCPVDIPFDWSKVTTREEANKLLSMPRDSIMAVNTVNYLNRLPPGSKVLIIQNSSHAFSNCEDFMGKWYLYYLKDRIDTPIANVFIQNLAWEWAASEGKGKYKPIHKGKWDAAFTYLDMDNVGFDLEGTPFGKNRFDYILDRFTNLTYADIFTGMVYMSPAKMYHGWGLNESVTPDFMAEMQRRHKIIGYPMDEETIYEWYNIIDDETTYDYCPDYDKIIRRQMRRIK